MSYFRIVEIPQLWGNLSKDGMKTTDIFNRLINSYIVAEARLSQGGSTHDVSAWYAVGHHSNSASRRLIAGTGENAKWLRVTVVLTEDLGWFSEHTT